MNNETKVRRSTRSIVLKKAKVISFEDIKVARVARAMKEVIKGKGRHSRKRKSTTLEAYKPEIKPEPEVAHVIEEVIKDRGKHSLKRKSTTLEADKPKL
jgi:hypothetical protein